LTEEKHKAYPRGLDFAGAYFLSLNLLFIENVTGVLHIFETQESKLPIHERYIHGISTEPSDDGSSLVHVTPS
jgi:hypothetical protein